MKYLSLFSGIAGFELGIQQAYEENNSNRGNAKECSSDDKSIPSINRSDGERGRTHPTCIGYSEIDKYAIQIYKKNFNHKNYGDITKIIPSEIPDFDFLVGGFPCQSFSIAGKRGGFNDTRGTLFFDIARILADKKPKDLLLENVKGLLSHDGGRTFQTIIGVLTDLGYFVEWQVLNSKNFGVPQNRERVFIRGHLGGEPRRKVFPIGESNSSDIAQLNQPKHSNDRVYKQDGISPTLNTAQGGRRQPKIGIDTGGLQKIATAIDANYHKGNGHRGNSRGRTLALDGMKIRRLTPTECERLQGFEEIEKYATIKVCLDHQNNLANVEIKNHKLPRYVGSVEKNKSIENVSFVETSSHSSNPQTNKLVQADVLIDCVENGVEIRSQGKLLLNAKYAGKKDWYHPLIKIEDFVQLLVGISTTKEKITNCGEAGLHQKEQPLTPQESGEMQEKLFGKEIMQPVGDVKNDLITLNELLKFTTLNHSNTENLEQRLQTLSLFVIRAIIGYIPKEILNQNIFTIGIRTRVGYTYGVSDTQRYKTLGNAVTVNVVREIVKRLF